MAHESTAKQCEADSTSEEEVQQSSIEIPAIPTICSTSTMFVGSAPRIESAGSINTTTDLPIDNNPYFHQTNYGYTTNTNFLQQQEEMLRYTPETPLTVVSTPSPASVNGQCEISPIGCNRPSNQQQPVSSQSYDSEPCLNTYPGNLGFQIHVGSHISREQSNSANSPSPKYIFDEGRQKLYIERCATCPLSFFLTTTSSHPHNLFIRAQLVYKDPQHIQQPVERCHDHKHKDSQYQESANAACHILRCDNPYAKHYSNFYSGRCSVTLPYSPPPQGSVYTDIFYSFHCLTSCSGGPNRRSMALVCSLENDKGYLLGRQVIEVRVCACPARDRRSDEERSNKARLKDAGLLVDKRKRSSNDVKRSPIKLKQLKEENPLETYNISVSGIKNYELMMTLKTTLEMDSPTPSSTEIEWHKRLLKSWMDFINSTAKNNNQA